MDSSERTSEKYTPIPYTFRLPNDSTFYPAGKAVAKCPPFYIQLDHAIAVVWSLFSVEPTSKPLGVAQIQWALSFLKGIKNRKGEHPPDIIVCIETMEEALIKQYADMADSVTSVEPTETVSAPVVESPSKISTEHLSFSVNYADMMKYKVSPSERTLCPGESEASDKYRIATSTPAKNICSKTDMIEFLKDFRKEQVTKVQDELKRLKFIESYIGHIDSCNFKPYLDSQDVATFKSCDCKK